MMSSYWYFVVFQIPEKEQKEMEVGSRRTHEMESQQLDETDVGEL